VGAGHRRDGTARLISAGPSGTRSLQLRAEIDEASVQIRSTASLRRMSFIDRIATGLIRGREPDDRKKMT
jgi:hypothetical protein